MQRIEDRVAVVTGAASGIGLGIARAFVGAGMKVVLADVRDGAELLAAVGPGVDRDDRDALAHGRLDGVLERVRVRHRHDQPGLALCHGVVDELGLFDAMIEVRSHTKRLRIVYDTPYIRNLPTRLEIAEGTPDGVRQRILGPFYTDAFAEELKTFHRHIQDGTKPKTDLADSRRDLALMVQIIERMRQAKRI